MCLAAVMENIVIDSVNFHQTMIRKTLKRLPCIRSQATILTCNILPNTFVCLFVHCVINVLWVFCCVQCYLCIVFLCIAFLCIACFLCTVLLMYYVLFFCLRFYLCIVFVCTVMCCVCCFSLVCCVSVYCDYFVSVVSLSCAVFLCTLICCVWFFSLECCVSVYCDCLCLLFLSRVLCFCVL